MLKRVELSPAVTFRTSLEGRSTRSVGRELLGLKRSVRVHALTCRLTGSLKRHELIALCQKGGNRRQQRKGGSRTKERDSKGAIRGSQLELPIDACEVAVCLWPLPFILAGIITKVLIALWLCFWPRAESLSLQPLPHHRVPPRNRSRMITDPFGRLT